MNDDLGTTPQEGPVEGDAALLLSENWHLGRRFCHLHIEVNPPNLRSKSGFRLVFIGQLILVNGALQANSRTPKYYGLGRRGT